MHSSTPQVGSVEVPVSAEGLFPAVGMHSMGEEVKVDLQAEWFLEEDDSMMMVDSHEDDWGRLYDVRVSGTVRRPLLFASLLKEQSNILETQLMRFSWSQCGAPYSKTLI